MIGKDLFLGIYMVVKNIFFDRAFMQLYVQFLFQSFQFLFFKKHTSWPLAL